MITLKEVHSDEDGNWYCEECGYDDRDSTYYRLDLAGEKVTLCKNCLTELVKEITKLF